MEGFSFLCASAANPDASLKAFLKADPQSVVDPFPLIARRKSFHQDRTNPLVKLHYWALPNLETVLENDLLNLYQAMRYGHERQHMDNDDTPAKRWAQYLEGAALQRVNEILMAATWDTEAAKSWSELRKINRQLATIASRIRFAEELLATAKSFVKMERLISTNPDFAHWQRRLGTVEDESVAYYEREELRPLFPDFRTLYFGTIKKAIDWAAFDEPGFLAPFLRIFLQGLNISGEPNTWTVDSHQQCLLLAEQVKGMDSPSQLSDWLKEMIRNEDLYLSGLGFQEKLVDDARGTIVEYLCHMIHKPQGENSDLSIPEWVHPYISPKLLGTQWHIQLGAIIQVEASDPPDVSYIESTPVMIILKLEALLEQLIAGDGICCPYYYYESNGYDACICTSDWKKSLMRLLQWGREGKFGPGGTWRDLPPECSCGV
jgi:hypothetical protein